MSVSPTENATTPSPEPADAVPKGAPSSPGKRETPAAEPEEEVDVWWGAYSMWTMTPSLVICILLSVAIIVAVWSFRSLRDVPLLSFTVGGAIWLVQTIRWAYRIIFYNYRLTTRRLLADRGLFYPDSAQVDLASVAQVQVQTNWVEKRVGVGRICVFFEKNIAAPLVLEGVQGPQRIAEMIRETAKRAREHNAVAVGAKK
jgi:hypothetical protein